MGQLHCLGVPIQEVIILPLLVFHSCPSLCAQGPTVHGAIRRHSLASVEFPILFGFLLCTHSRSFSSVGGIIVAQKGSASTGGSFLTILQGNEQPLL